MSEGIMSFRESVQVVLALAAAAAALTFLLMPTHRADAAGHDLMSQVNAAIRDAGVPVTVARSNAFQVGVHIGHYKTYDQLVGAILYHKAQETLPEFSQKDPTVATTCLTGNVLSLSDTNISFETDGIKPNGNRGVHTRIVKIATNQYDFAVAQGAKADSNVTLCSADNWKTQYGHLTVNSK